MNPEALYYRKLKGKLVQCELCPRNCVIAEGQVGFCRVRSNHDGNLISLVYGKSSGVQVDPIEKKPFFHFLPGSRALSFGTVGCTLRCTFCQNFQISQASASFPSEELPPNRIVGLAREYACESIAYTYNEPTVFYEYMADTARLARKKGIRNLMVSNGFISQKPLAEACKFIDAANIDLKGFSNKFYGSMTASWLEPILQALKTLHKKHVWLEITNLIIPKHNDNPEEIKQMCGWIMDNLGPDVPLHFSAFRPDYLLQDVPVTSVESLLSARELASKSGLKHVYLGNVITNDGETTFCPKCGKALIKRLRMTIISSNMDGRCCSFCGEKIPGVF